MNTAPCPTPTPVLLCSPDHITAHLGPFVVFSRLPNLPAALASLLTQRQPAPLAHRSLKGATCCPCAGPVPGQLGPPLRCQPDAASLVTPCRPGCSHCPDPSEQPCPSPFQLFLHPRVGDRAFLLGCCPVHCGLCSIPAGHL